MPRILNGIIYYLKSIKQSLTKIDISLKNADNVTQVFNIYEKTKPIKELEYMFSDLRIFRKELSKKFFENIQTYIAQFQKTFKLLHNKVYQLEKTKIIN